MSGESDAETLVAGSGHLTAAKAYRERAADERAAAAVEALPNRRHLLLRSAEAWDQRAAVIEDMLSQRQINDASKVPRLPPRPFDRTRKR